MENKKSVGKYMLIFEPRYDFYQYAVRFTTNGDVDVRKVRKYTDEMVEVKNGKVLKNTLADIDRVLTPLTDLRQFFDSYVSPGIFRYRGDNLHKMFIGYKYNGTMYSLDYSINNKELHSKLDFVDGATINDYYGKRKAISLILNSENNSFLMFMNRAARERKTHLTDLTINIANQLRAAYNSDSYHEYGELESDFERRLTSYKEYREMFLLRQRYIEEMETKKAELNNLKEQAIATSQLQNSSFVPYVGEQLSFFDSPYEGYVKSLKNKDTK